MTPLKQANGRKSLILYVSAARSMCKVMQNRWWVKKTKSVRVWEGWSIRIQQYRKNTVSAWSMRRRRTKICCNCSQLQMRWKKKRWAQVACSTTSIDQSRVLVQQINKRPVSRVRVSDSRLDDLVWYSLQIRRPFSQMICHLCVFVHFVRCVTWIFVIPRCLKAFQTVAI